MTDIYVQPGSGKYLKFAKSRLAKLRTLRESIDLPAMSKYYVPEPGVRIHVHTSDWGDKIRIFRAASAESLLAFFLKVETSWTYSIITPEILALEAAMNAAIAAYGLDPSPANLAAALAAISAYNAAVAASTGQVVPSEYLDETEDNFGCMPPQYILLEDQSYPLSMLVNPSFKKQWPTEYTDITHYLNPASFTANRQEALMRYCPDVEHGTYVWYHPPAFDGGGTITDQHLCTWIGNVDNKVPPPADFDTYTDGGYPALDPAEDFNITPAVLGDTVAFSPIPPVGTEGYPLSLAPVIAEDGTVGFVRETETWTDLAPSADSSTLTEVNLVTYYHSDTPTVVCNSPLPALPGGEIRFNLRSSVVARGDDEHWYGAHSWEQYETSDPSTPVSGHARFIKDDGTVLYSEDISPLPDLGHQFLPLVARARHGHWALAYIRGNSSAGTATYHLKWDGGDSAVWFTPPTGQIATAPFAERHMDISVEGTPALMAVTPRESADPGSPSTYLTVQIGALTRFRTSIAAGVLTGGLAWTPDGRYLAVTQGTVSRLFYKDGTPLSSAAIIAAPASINDVTQLQFDPEFTVTVDGSNTTYVYTLRVFGTLNVTTSSAAAFRTLTVVDNGVSQIATYGTTTAMPRTWNKMVPRGVYYAPASA